MNYEANYVHPAVLADQIKESTGAEVVLVTPRIDSWFEEMEPDKSRERIVVGPKTERTNPPKTQTSPPERRDVAPRRSVFAFFRSLLRF